MVGNKYRADIANFSSIAETQDFYVVGGYFFGEPEQDIRFKPTMKMRLAFGTDTSVSVDFGANWMFWDKFWLGGMYRTDNTFAILSQFMFIKNTTIGYALELPFGSEMGRQLQTHEIRLSFEYDFFKRKFMRQAYF